MKATLPSTPAWPRLAVFFLFFLIRAAGAAPVANYTALTNALAQSPVVTSFVNHSIITLASNQTIQITRDSLIDAGGDDVTIDGANLTRLFNVHPHCQLTLANLRLQRGQSAAGSAIYNQGSLIVSNCFFIDNNATNASGLVGSNASTNSPASAAGAAGGSVWGGAIYSLGPLSVYNSVFSTNSAVAGNGGNGGNGYNITGNYYAGNGAAGGNGGAAWGGAIYSAGGTNIILDTEFLGNVALAGKAGAGGAAGINAGNYLYDGGGGQGGAGGAGRGGAVYIVGAASLSNCLFYYNGTVGGSSADAAGAFNGSGNNAHNGGPASGGGLVLSAAPKGSDLENCTFFQNFCIAGSGGNASATSSTAGSGGAATGGGLAIEGGPTFLRSCTFATNTLQAGAAGTDSGTNGVNGATGAAQGANIYRGAGTAQIADSILAGSAANAYSVSDAGYNISSDASLPRLYPTTQLRTDARVAPSLAANGGPPLGPTGAPQARLSLALVPGSPAAQAALGVPGVTFPVTDERDLPRQTPGSIGAFEANVLLVTNSATPQITSEPQNQIASLGGPANLSVGVDTNSLGTNAMGYQWQLNGVNLTESGRFIGVNSPNLEILDLSAADLGAYQVVISESVLGGETNSSVAYLLVNIPTRIKQQPASHLNVPSGSVVEFKVTVSGSPPFFYQWFSNGAPLSDGDEFSGSQSANLIINPATAGDAATYTVTISNFSHTITSANARLTVAPDNARPRITITSPGANARTTDAIVAGTTTDNAQVVNVNCWITNIFEGVSSVIETNAALSTDGTTAKTWAVSNIFSPGTNIVAVQAVDYTGNVSALVSRKFFYIVPARLGLTFTGVGSAIGRTSIPGTTLPANGAMLNVGQGYTLVAKPGTGYLLTNWASPDFTSSSSALVFTMTPGLNIAANFVPSPFLGAPGPYNGLFFDTNDVNIQTAGMLSQLKVGALGSYTGKLLLEGATYALSGAFNIFGQTTNHFTRGAAKGGPFDVLMTLDWTTGKVTGFVQNPDADWQAPIFAEAAAAAPATAGESTLLLAPSEQGVGEPPPGDGYVLITNHNGNLTLTGALPDGATFSETVPLGKNGDFPLYKSLYGNTGLMLGWASLHNGVPAAPNGIYWIRPAKGALFYPGGFTNILSASGSPWVNNAAFSGALTVANQSVNTLYQISVANNILTDAVDSPGVKGTVNAKTGLLTLKIPSGRSFITGYGAILENATNLGGYFVTKTNTGSISLTP